MGTADLRNRKHIRKAITAALLVVVLAVSLPAGAEAQETTAGAYFAAMANCLAPDARTGSWAQAPVTGGPPDATSEHVYFGQGAASGLLTRVPRGSARFGINAGATISFELDEPTDLPLTLILNRHAPHEAAYLAWRADVSHIVGCLYLTHALASQPGL